VFRRRFERHGEVPGIVPLRVLRNTLMNSSDPLSPDTVRLEELTVALNRELYAESAGLPFNESAMRAIAEQDAGVSKALRVSAPARFCA
jgi:hypothetical protein